MLHAYPKQARPMRVLRTQCKMQFGTAAKHTNVNVSYEKPYKGHKCIQNKINNDSKPCKGHRVAIIQTHKF